MTTTSVLIAAEAAAAVRGAAASLVGRPGRSVPRAWLIPATHPLAGPTVDAS